MFGRRNCCQDRQMGFGMPQMNSCCMEQPIIEPTINKCIEKEQNFTHNPTKNTRKWIFYTHLSRI